MTMETISTQFGKGGTGLNDPKLRNILVELQGLKFAVLTAGPTDSVAAAVSGMAAEDTLLFVMADAAGTWSDVTADCSIDTSGELASTVDHSTKQLLVVWFDKQ